jgi:HD-GYP domain-containing protein (c-di-GMP phosphodiesterase class II)
VADALTFARPYQEAFSNPRSLEIMKAERDRHFDPTLLDLFVSHFEKIQQGRSNGVTR